MFCLNELPVQFVGRTLCVPPSTSSRQGFVGLTREGSSPVCGVGAQVAIQRPVPLRHRINTPRRPRLSGKACICCGPAVGCVWEGRHLLFSRQLLWSALSLPRSPRSRRDPWQSPSPSLSFSRQRGRGSLSGVSWRPWRLWGVAHLLTLFFSGLSRTNAPRWRSLD
jgi:hypothetical protein